MNLGRMMRRGAVAAAALLLVGISNAPASAVPIAETGVTEVTVDAGFVAALIGAGITPSPIAPGTASGATFSFPITGGETDTLTITHSGGVLFDDGSSFVQATNFTIDGAGGEVRGTALATSVVTSPTEAPLFALSNVDTSGPITADLLITGTLDAVLRANFPQLGEASLEGAKFGTASTSPAPVPLPAAGWLLIAGLGALGAARRMRKAA